MYKVFFNEKLIVITDSSNITLFKTVPVKIESVSKREINRIVESFIEGEENELVLVHPNPNFLFEKFSLAFIPIQAAGGVVIREDKILFIYRNEKWDLPKGKIEPNETAEQAGIREVEEECGIESLKISKKLPSTFHIYRSPYKKTEGKLIFKETIWFEMIYEGMENGMPQTEEGITKVRWFSKKELKEILGNTYENLKQIIHLYCD